MHRTETDLAKARCYTKAARRGLTFRSRAKAGNGVPKYCVEREGFEVWWGHQISEIEDYLEKLPPRDWLD